MKKRSFKKLPPSMSELVKKTFRLDEHKKIEARNKWLDFILNFKDGHTNKEKIDEFYRLLSEDAEEK